MKSLKNKPILHGLLLGILLVVVISIFSAAASIRNSSDNVFIIFQIAAFFIMGLYFTFYMLKEDKSLKQFGFINPSGSARNVHYYIPLLLIPLIQPLLCGINFSLSPLSVLLLLIQMSLVGYTEEILFRAIYKYIFRNKSHTFYIVFSSFVFGILHIANGLIADNLILVLLQIINALLIGIMLALIYLYGKSIYPFIIFHGLFNFLASVCNEISLSQNYFLIILLGISYLIYILFLLLKNGFPR